MKRFKIDTIPGKLANSKSLRGAVARALLNNTRGEATRRMFHINAQVWTQRDDDVTDAQIRRCVNDLFRMGVIEFAGEYKLTNKWGIERAGDSFAG